MDKKAVSLISGGLDSILATKIIQEQGIEIFGLHFITPFCNYPHWTKKLESLLNIPIKNIFLGQEYIEIVKKPKYGYGKNMNPCIDCRIFMLKIARKYLNEIGASFIITGEVLNERSMSQTKQSMQIIEKEAGLEGKIERPLSAKLLEPTVPELIGIVDRDKLFSIKGRRRIHQMELAKTFGIKNYPQPAGGCRLTDTQFAKRFKDTIKYNEDSLDFIHLLNYGRHFRLPDGSKVIVGRNETENKILLNFANNKFKIIEAIDYPGPIVLLKGNDIMNAAKICARYCDGKGEIKIKCDDKIITTTAMEEREIAKYRI